MIDGDAGHDDAAAMVGSSAMEPRRERDDGPAIKAAGGGSGALGTRPRAAYQSIYRTIYYDEPTPENQTGAGAEPRVPMPDGAAIRLTRLTALRHSSKNEQVGGVLIRSAQGPATRLPPAQ
jgi:hypothetical protein